MQRTCPGLRRKSSGTFGPPERDPPAPLLHRELHKILLPHERAKLPNLLEIHAFSSLPFLLAQRL
jgi:hypothetical protein